ncbi:sigma factor-like helix-turn-helix DNA-binding protein [Planomonospora parontospora]|uniref:sigma factor-like helix-turn-helix DNA-binding protein n=1 Tax=Planomonospora parontospora TaxID=58119 RepID=UPI00360BB622
MDLKTGEPLETVPSRGIDGISSRGLDSVEHHRKGTTVPSSDLDRIAAIDDPYLLLRAATERLNAAQQEVTELARLRRRVIQELHAQGMSYAQIAEKAGLSRGRIHQIKHTGPAPEGAFLGTGTITLATPLKREAGNARPVVAMEDVTAAKRLEDLARGFGLAVNLEHVPRRRHRSEPVQPHRHLRAEALPRHGCALRVRPGARMGQGRRVDPA